MDVKKAKLYLKKINRLFGDIEEDNGNISSIEKDLMLSYVRGFYETLREEAVVLSQKNAPKPQPVVEQPKYVAPQPPKPQPVVEQPKYVAPQPPKPQPVVEQPKYVAPQPPKPQPVVEQPKYVAPKPQPKYEAIKVPPKSQSKPASEPVQPAINFDEFDILFEEDMSTVKDLQHKLSQSKVTNLRNAMGINERFLIQNELFGGNNNAFNDAIDRLNGFDNFIQAKAFIIKNLAPENNWLEEKRIKRAKSFIRTVIRRYKS